MWRCLLVLGALVLTFPANSDACTKLNGTVVDTRGNVQVNAAITVYRTEVGTLATLYSDPDCTTTKANPTTSSAAGHFSFFVADGTYDLNFSKTGFSFTNLTNVNIFAPVGDNVWLATQFNTSDVCDTTNGAIAQIGSSTATLMVNTPVTCGTTSTAPSTLHWMFVGSGLVSVDAGVTLTVQGPVTPKPGATNWSGSGTLAFGSGVTPHPFGKLGTAQPSYGATVSIETNLGRFFVIVVTDANNFTIGAPTHGAIGDIIFITIKNSSGGAMGSITWNAVYKKASFTNPSNGNNRSIMFWYDGTNWIESSPATDIPN